MASVEEVARLAPWCKDNFLILNTKNTKGIKGNAHWPQEKTIHHREIHINQEEAEGVHFQIPWSADIWGPDLGCNHGGVGEEGTVVPIFHMNSETRQTLKGPPEKKIYRYTIQSVLTYYFTVWYTSCTAEERKDLQQVVKRSQWIIVTIHFTVWSLIFLYSIYLWF